MRDMESPETYIGYKRAENFVSPGGAVRDMAYVYAAGEPDLNQWGLSGNWTITSEHALLNQPDGAIIYRFHAGIFILCLDLALSNVRFISVSRSTERRPQQATGWIVIRMDEAS